MSPAAICGALLTALVVLNSPVTTPAYSAALYAVSEADTRLPEGSPPGAKPSRYSHRAEWGRDPFQHPLKKAASPHGGVYNGTRLVGIIGGKNGRVAIFGHSVLQKGDMVGSERIVEIDESQVTVTREGSKRIIAMQETR